MNDLRPNQGDPVPGPMQHLSDWTIELLAEGALPDEEQRSAEAHLERCMRCSSELSAYRSLFTALDGLPRFAPAPDFSDAVLARVRIAPQESWVLARARRWLPKTRRGWMLMTLALIAPALPVLALLVWLFSQPLVTAGALLNWASVEAFSRARVVATYATGWAASAGLPAVAENAHQLLLGVPTGALVTVVALLAVAIPLSAWSLVRLLRTPDRDIHYAN